MNHQPALVLNTDGIPLRVINWKRAICLDILGKEIPEEGITVLKYYDDYVTSAGGLTIQVPAVGMTNRYINISRTIPLTKHNLMVRDKGRCQYCFEKLSDNISTIDHVIPKRMYNRKADCHVWDNVVIACRSCNIKKGGRTPGQAGMPLINKPYEPNAYNFWGFKKLPEWEEFLRYN